MYQGISPGISDSVNLRIPNLPAIPLSFRNSHHLFLIYPQPLPNIIFALSSCVVSHINPMKPATSMTKLITVAFVPFNPYCPNPVMNLIPNNKKIIIGILNRFFHGANNTAPANTTCNIPTIRCIGLSNNPYIFPNVKYFNNGNPYPGFTISVTDTTIMMDNIANTHVENFFSLPKNLSKSPPNALNNPSIINICISHANCCIPIPECAIIAATIKESTYGGDFDK